MSNETKVVVAGSLAESLPLFDPFLDGALLSKDASARLLGVARHLPPVHRAGFECRLSAGDGQVDLQQGIIPKEWEQSALTAHALQLASQTTSSTRDAWTRVAEFAARWPEGVSELWLEYDVPSAGFDDAEGRSEHTNPTPSIFAVLAPDERTGDGYRAVTEIVLTKLIDSDNRHVVGVAANRLSECAKSHGGWVSHVGLMLGRTPVGARLHLSGIPQHAFPSLLRELQFSGNIHRACQSAALLFDVVDELVLCFDVVSRERQSHLLPRVGLEGFFAQKVGVDPRWEALFDLLVTAGLADVSKTNALLRWPGSVTPLDARAPWPDDLVCRSLLKPSSCFGQFGRRLSHVKLSHDGDSAPLAKAYFGYGHLWFDAAATKTATPPTVMTVPNSSTRSLSRALDDAESAIVNCRNQAGWWRDFFDVSRSSAHHERVYGYASDEWVTAYVGAIMAQTGRPASLSAARHAWELLERRRVGANGWGYHAQLPIDADSTTWALKLARTLGVERTPRMGNAEGFLSRQTRISGGVVTYQTEDCDAIAQFLRMEGPYDGWCSPHDCVTAAVASLDLDARHRERLLACQQDDGRWVGHWWDDDEYATAMAVGAIAGDEREESRIALERAGRWAAARVGATGAVFSDALGAESPFATALATRILLSTAAFDEDGGRAEDALNRAVDWLLDVQMPDGRFKPSALLRVPAPREVNPCANPCTTVTYLDQDSVFTTATVFGALAAVSRRRGPGSKSDESPNRV